MGYILYKSIPILGYTFLKQHYNKYYMLISEYMGEKSSVTINTPGKASLKTTIPISMVKQFGINQGDQLDWSLGKYGENELVMVVRKEGKKLEQNIIPFEYIEKERRKTLKKLKDILTEEEIEEISK